MEIKIIKETNDNIKEIGEFTLRDLNNQCNSEDIDGKANTKIRGKLKYKIKSADESKKMKISVFKNYDVSNETFEDAIYILTNEFTQTSANEYDIKVTAEQMEKLEAMDEVMIISDVYESEPDTIDGYVVSEEDTATLNASTEMIGVKSARADFGVTGDRDGKETTYTKNDIVIAVLDTGIDSSHVDLDGGKVIGWYDAVAGKTDPYDDNGHGTNVSSIIAGTGEGDSSGTQI